ncbi:signal transduction histidine kinase [Candidatus Magnetobacterium bavaricum]|uniref:Signal transduction histidine kinase n=1 Tax=Candidatus Magnetobacterium bavaricum TaxID=29290 RepID=A0A0F3GT17_9BACT|nr:signal transduction histidine kinase [Candidatus Magnetobacterium bavaricum]
MFTEESILIVDSDDKIDGQVKGQLVSAYANICIVRSAQEALRVFSSRTIDVVFIDIGMMQTEGQGLIKEALRVQPGARCIVVSGYDDIKTALDRLIEAPIRARQELIFTSGITRVTQSLLDTKLTFYDIAKTIEKESLMFTESKHCIVSIIDEATGDNLAITLTDMMDKDCKIAREKQQTRFPKSPHGYNALWGHSLNTREGFYTNAPQGHPAFKSCVPHGHIPIERFLSVPAVSKERLIGQIALANSVRDYNDNDLKMITQLAAVYAIAIERKHIEEQQEELKNHVLRYADHLEEVVHERTKKLSIANEQLTQEVQRRQQVEQEITASLKDKTILLKEIHHRVKNNLQIISSLLSLQAENITDKKLLGIFHDSLNRIKSMALIHEHLYKSADMSKLDFSEYIEEMTRDILLSYGNYVFGVPQLRLNVTVDYLDTDIAIPCGLVICELVSNAMKYAFPDNRKGEINISFSRPTEDTFELVVRDNGIGLPENVDEKGTKSLGLMLVRDLITRKLRGSIEIDSSSRGTTFKMVWGGPKR